MLSDSMESAYPIGLCDDPATQTEEINSSDDTKHIQASEGSLRATEVSTWSQGEVVVTT
jgi:hypothetical protein